MKIIEVLTEYSVYSLNRPFSYIYKGDEKIDTGFRVLVSFNNREIIGYVTKVKETNLSKEELEDELGFEMNEIIDVIDDAPLLNEELLLLADQVADYYVATKISVLQAMLPPSLAPRKSSLKKPKIAYEKYIKVVDDDEEGLTAKQKELLRLLKQYSLTPKREIKQPSVLAKLIELGKVVHISLEKKRFKLPEYEEEIAPVLTKEQGFAVDSFFNSPQEVHLLHGVTGSGKTEVYLKISEQILKEGKDVLMLVPEISLTPRMVEYFQTRYKGNVAVLHSQLTPAEKYDEYRKIANGEAHIVVGARSAIFAPLKNIGLIILDEEHVESYKQENQPYYHAREVAILRNKYFKGKIILGSATPSLETKARALKGVYNNIVLSKRINEQPLPETKIINMADYHNIDRDSSLFSLQLRREILGVLSRGEQAILLINKRGFSSSVTCRKCGYNFKCPNCGVPLTYHRTDNMLKCHHCDHVEEMHDKCPECGGKYFSKYGLGTEKIEEEVQRLFPGVRTLRLDSDSAKIRTKIPAILEQFRNFKADILIGTQMIAKGHDFPNVTLVGVVLADLGLSIPSFRSNERTFQLITQAVGRSGRSDKKGKAIIQTYIPKNQTIISAAIQDYNIFYKLEMENRRDLNYPPYNFLVGITVSAKTEENVIFAAGGLKDFLSDNLPDAKVLGPTVPYISQENDKYIRTLLIKHKNIEKTKAVLHRMVALFSSKSAFKFTINIDPYNF